MFQSGFLLHQRCWRHVCAFVLIALIAPALLSGPARSHDLDVIRVQFHWLEQFEFAGFYVAKQKGFYRDAGLEVEFLPYRKGETDVVESVIHGEADFAVGYSSLIADYHRGKPLVALAAIFQDSPLVLLTRDEPEIASVADLRGRRVMLGGDAFNAAPIMSLMFSQGLSREDIRPQAHSHDVGDLIAGRTDALSAYRSNEPFEMRRRGVPYRMFAPKDVGLSFYGDILFSSASQVAEHPDRTSAFVAATLKGWRYAFRHIDETVALLQEHYNEQGRSAAALRFEAEALKPLAMGDGVPLGRIELATLEKISDAYKLMGIPLSDRPLEPFLWSRARHGGDGSIVLTRQERDFVANTVLNVATTSNWTPIAHTDPNTGQPTGIGYEFWQLIAKQAGFKQTITPFDSFADELSALAEGRQDVIFSVGRSPERERYALFSDPYARFPLAIATSKDEHFIPDAHHLDGRTVAVGRNFTADRMMRKAHPELDYLPVDNVQDGLQAVSEGRAYAFVDILPVLAHSIDRHGFTNLKISGNTGLHFDLRIMVRKELAPLIPIANKVIAALPHAQSQDILNRWIKVRYEQSFDYGRYLPFALGLLLIAALLFLWLFLAKQQAQRANRAKSEFLALMSHDLRTPLNAIVGFSDVMRQQTFGPIGNARYAQYVEDIHKSGQLLVNLINDLLDLSRVEAGKYQLEEEDIDLRPLADLIVEQCIILGQDRDIRLINAVPADFPLLRGDRRVLTQILNNLLSNAIKFSHASGRVELSAARGRQGTIDITVRDDGIGIAPDELERLMRPFERADRQEVRRAEGTGLGLYLCQTLVRLFGGTLKIDSMPGRGTTASITFPSERTVARPPDAPSHRAA